MQDLNHYRSAVRSYPALQGFRIIPIGLLFLIFPLQNLNLPVLGRQGNCTITLPLLLVAIASWFWIGRYYEKNFGKVEPLLDHDRRFITVPITLLVFIAAVVLEVVLSRNHLALPFSLVEFLVALAALYVGIKTRRWYYSLAGFLLGIACFLPLILAVDVGDPIFGEFGVFFNILYGLAIIFVGVLDHLRLLSYFPPKGADIDAGNP
jgi:hypothetical protein